MEEHNIEDQDGFLIRPTLDLYICNRYWNYLTKDLERDQVADFENAKK